MADSAFSENGNYYAAISSDGRLKIWDTETNVLKQEYTPDLHLTSPASCLQWLTVSTTGSTQKSKKHSSVTEQEAQCVALGTSSGKILLYSVAQAKVQSILVQEKNSDIQKVSITCLDWHREYGLYSCNKSNFVLEWDLESGFVKNKYNVSIDNKKQSVSSIRIVPHKQNTSSIYLVTASWQIRLWRLYNSEATALKILGHNASKGLLTIASLNNACWLIEGSQNERLLSFWDVTVTSDQALLQNGDAPTPKRQRKKSISSPTLVATPSYNFVLEDAPKSIDVNVKDEDGGTKLNLAAVTRSGVIHYYGHMLNGPSSKPIKPSVTIQVTTGDALPMPAQCCRLMQHDLLIGYSKGVVTVFERVTPDLKSKTQVLIRSEGKSKKSKQDAQNEATKVKSVDQSKGVTYLEPMGGSVLRKRATPGATIEVPMEARLANLAIDPTEQSKIPVNQNLTKLLMQGLHSQDKQMILAVLQKNEPAVANRTVSKLPPDHIPMLLDQLAEMATRKTTQCACAATWLSAVLRWHSALLLATANAACSDKLMHLLAVFTHRRSHLCQLLNLKGRLELTTTLRTAAATVPDNQEAILEYNDTSDSDEEIDMEDKLSSNASDQSFSEHEHVEDDNSDTGDTDGD